MRYEVLLAPEAVEDLDRLDGRRRAEVKDRLRRHLRYEPTKVSKSRIKRLRGMAQPQYRLRVGGMRIFYDVEAAMVQVLAVVPKDAAAAWLAAWGVQDEADSPV